MDNNAHVFKIMIASPSDARKQRQEIKNIIFDLNTFYSEQNLFLFPYMWEKDVPAGFYEDDIQDTIDEKITQNSDLIVGIFKGKIGRIRDNRWHTGYDYLVSYTVGEIKDHVQRGKQGVIVFIDPDRDKYSEKEIEDVYQLRAHLNEVIGINVLDLRFSSEEEFSNNITEKLRQSIDEMIKTENNRDDIFKKNVQNEFTFFEKMSFPNNYGFAGDCKTFQTIPYFSGGKLRDEIKDIVGYSFNKLKEFYFEKSGYWTSDVNDSCFNRVYYTSSVLTYLFQLGVDQDNNMVKKSLAFIRNCDSADINFRAGTFFLMAFHLLSEYNARRFIQALIKYDSSKRGVIFLPQEDITKSNDVRHWVGKYHIDGASFHACHISDYLLHMDNSFTEAKAVAEPLLWSLKQYIIDELDNNEGFLTSLERKKSTITLYGYAISAALGIKLPANWLEVVRECKKMLLYDTEDDFKRCLGVMNFAYMNRMSDNHDLKIIANDYIKVELEYLWENREKICTDANNTSRWARAFIYGHGSLSANASYYYKALSKQENSNGRQYF